MVSNIGTGGPQIRGMAVAPAGASVPAPSAVVLFALGVVSLVGYAQKRRRET